MSSACSLLYLAEVSSELGTAQPQLVFSPPSQEDRDDQRVPNGLKLNGHVLHLHDEYGGGDGDHPNGPQ